MFCCEVVIVAVHHATGSKRSSNKEVNLFLMHLKIAHNGAEWLPCAAPGYTAVFAA